MFCCHSLYPWCQKSKEHRGSRVYATAVLALRVSEIIIVMPEERTHVYKMQLHLRI